MQTATRNGQRLDESAAGIKENLANVADDLMILAELQTKLLTLDLQDAAAKARGPVILMIGGGCVALGALPPLLMGLGGLLARSLEWSEPLGWLVVAGVALVVGVGAAWAASQNLCQCGKIFDRSRTELTENIAWIKRVIQRSFPARRPNS